MSTAVYTSIRAALTTRLKSLPGLPSVAWENTTFTPVAGEPYIAPFIIWNESMQAEQGQQGANWEGGIYQLSCCYPPNQGPGPLNAVLDAIKDHFKRGTVLNYGGLTITVVKTHPGPGTTNSAGVFMPVTIVFRCQAPN
jgi:hypothetical protein